MSRPYIDDFVSGLLGAPRGLAAGARRLSQPTDAVGIWSDGKRTAFTYPDGRVHVHGPRLAPNERAA